MPQASAWRPVAVTWGVIAFYILVVVQLTSLVMKKLPKRVTDIAIQFKAAPLQLFPEGTGEATQQ